MYRIAVVTLLMVLASATGQAAATRPIVADAGREPIAVGYPPVRPLPFDPLTFESPADSWHQLRHRRWWAGLAAQAVVGAGLIGPDDTRSLAAVTEALLHRPEVHWDLARGPAHRRVRLQLLAERGRPRFAVGIVW